jgi:hypothetical protein
LILVLTAVCLILLVTATKQSLELALGGVPAQEAATLARQTRNAFLAIPAVVVLLGGVEILRRQFERWVDRREARDPTPRAIGKAFVRAHRIRVMLYFWIIRLGIPLFFALGFFGPRVDAGAADARIFLLIALANLLVWTILVRTRGPWTLNRDGRLERG